MFSHQNKVICESNFRLFFDVLQSCGFPIFDEDLALKISNFAALNIPRGGSKHSESYAIFFPSPKVINHHESL